MSKVFSLLTSIFILTAFTIIPVAKACDYVMPLKVIHRIEFEEATIPEGLIFKNLNGENYHYWTSFTITARPNAGIIYFPSRNGFESEKSVKFENGKIYYPDTWSEKDEKGNSRLTWKLSISDEFHLSNGELETMSGKDLDLSEIDWIKEGYSRSNEQEFSFKYLLNNEEKEIKGKVSYKVNPNYEEQVKNLPCQNWPYREPSTIEIASKAYERWPLVFSTVFGS
jgi:hypothetical protein